MAGLQIASPLQVPGISKDPFTSIENRQTVKNNYTLKRWKGQGGGDPQCKNQQGARDKVMSREAQSLCAQTHSHRLVK